MALRTGLVTAVLREESSPIGDDVTLVVGRVDGETDEIIATVVGDEPPPFGYAMFDDSFYPSWVCIGARGGVESVVREHFTSATVADVTVDGDNLQADGQWDVQIGTGVGAGFSGAHGTFAIDAQGEVILTAGAASGRYVTIRKNSGSTPLRADQMTWIRSRFSVDQTANHIGWIGLMDEDSSQTAGLSAAGLLINYPTATTLSVLSIVNGTGSPTGFVDLFAASTRYYLDLLISPSEFIAVFINGAGPYVIRHTTAQPVPGVADDLHLSAQSYTAGGAATRIMRLDTLHMDQVGAFELPEQFLPA